MNIDELLEIVQRTNPDMTEEKLIEEMVVCSYSTSTLLLVSSTTPKKYST